MKLKTIVRNLLPDWLLMRIEFVRHIGYWPRLNQPRSYSELLLRQLLKDDGRSNARFADKAAARDFVRERLGAEYLVPAVLITAQPAELARTELPMGVVVKSSAGSGMVKIIRDTTQAEWGALIPQFEGWLAHDYSRRHREKVYAHYPSRLVVEELLGSDDKNPPADYKVYVFNGKAKLIQLISDRGTDTRQTVYFPDGRPMPRVSKGFPIHSQPPRLTADLGEIVWVAEALAAGLDFVRVDLYWVDNRVYFGEMTFYPAALRTEFRPREFDFELGSVWLNGGSVSEKWAEP